MVINKLISKNNVGIEKLLNNWFSTSVFSDEGVFIKKIEGQNCKITIFIAEEYYFRINSTLTLTIIVEENTNGTSVEVVSSGGKEGLGGFSYGAEKSAVKRIVNLLKENSFTEIKYDLSEQ